MEFAVLGPLEVRLDGRVVALGGPKQRAVLAILLLNANGIVSRDRLIDSIWGEWPPTSASRSLDSYVSRLRTLLGKDRLERVTAGYRLRVEPRELDLERFDSLVERAAASASAGDLERAAATLREALALWRGPALADLAAEPVGQLEGERLNERRLLAIEALNDARLGLGDGGELVAELRRLVAEYPFRERLLGQLMLALYRGGRQAEALSMFQRARQRMADELGLDPAPQLRELERRILEQDPALTPPAPTSATRARGVSWPRRRRVLSAAALVLVLLLAVAVTAVVRGAGDEERDGAAIRASALLGLSASSGRRAAEVALPGPAAAVSAGAGSLWVADADAGTVSKIDLAASAVVDRISVGGSPGTLVVGGGFVWAASVPGPTIARIDPKTDAVTQRIPLGGARATALAYGPHGLWIADSTDDALIELAPDAGAVKRTIPLDLHPTALAVTADAIWVADYDARAIAEVNPASGRTVAMISVGNGPSSLAADGRAVWVANTLDSTVSKIDPIRASVATTIPVGSGPLALAVTRDGIWVANRYSATLSRIDPARDVVTETRALGGQPNAVSASGDKLWVAVQPVAQPRGGTLTLLHTRPLLIDPALQSDLPPPQADGLTRDGLVTYNHVSGPAGTQLVPDLALSLPTPTDRGTTYTFRLRPGIRYSDGRPLRASDFRRAIERDLNLRSWGSDLLIGIKGAAACLHLDQQTCDLHEGIATDDATRTITVHLVAPDPQFLAKLTTLGVAAPVPRGTPLRSTPARPIPGTGPYKVVHADSHAIRYVRNPYFHEWSHAAQPDGNPDRIVWRFGLAADAEVRAVERGEADWLADSPGPLLSTLATRRASQLHTYPTTETTFFQLNTTRPPFDDIRVRQALNLAIDRRTIVRLFGGRLAATPTCQVLPPGISGYRPYCPYTKVPNAHGTSSVPDLARAQRLVSASRTRGQRVTVWGWTDDPTISPRVITYTANVLRRLGYRTDVRLVGHNDFDRLPPRVRRAVQLIPAGWLDTNAYAFIATWLSCNGASNHGYFCSPALDRAIRRAHSLEASNPRAAAEHWAQVDHQLVDRAAWVTLVNEREVDFVSTRVTNFQHHPYWGLLIDQLVLK